ncbi:hypothetical protein ACS0TY_002571 [Phlomoides rotata]
MEEERQHHLIACHPERNPNLSFRKRKRKRSFRIMEELFEIEETHMSKRDTHDKAIKSSFVKGINEAASRDHIIRYGKTSVCSSEAQNTVHQLCKANDSIKHCRWLLADERHREYYTKYLPERRGLSAGWRGFSISHNLEEGDVLVFHLVGVWKMKVTHSTTFLNSSFQHGFKISNEPI